MNKPTGISSVANVRHAFFNRNGGVSEGAFASLNSSLNVGDAADAVMENRRRICAQMDVPQDKLYLPKQVHTDVIVRVVADSTQEEIAAFEADAIYTNHARIAIGIQTADCAPLLLTNRLGTAVMAVHLGWRSTALGLAQKAARFFADETKTPLRDLVAAIGPCIGFESFEVGIEVVDALKAQVRPDGLVQQRDASHWHVNLEGWIERALQDLGIVEIQLASECTVKHPERYFSYRRDGLKAGRQVSTIALK